MKLPPSAPPGCIKSRLQKCREAAEGLMGAQLTQQAEGTGQVPELQMSSNEGVNKKPTRIEMLIVKIANYLRKVIWLFETPTKDASLCPLHLSGSVKHGELNSKSKFTCDEVTLISQPAEHCCHAHCAEGSTAFQLFIWNPGGTVTCYLLLLFFFFLPLSLTIFCLSATTESFCCPWLVGIYSTPAARCIIPELISQCYFRLMQMWGLLTVAL